MKITSNMLISMTHLYRAHHNTIRALRRRGLVMQDHRALTPAGRELLNSRSAFNGADRLGALRHDYRR